MALGQARALGDKRGIRRYGEYLVPRTTRRFRPRWTFRAGPIWHGTSTFRPNGSARSRPNWRALPDDGAFPGCRRAMPFLGICAGMQLLASMGSEYKNGPSFGCCVSLTAQKGQRRVIAAPTPHDLPVRLPRRSSGFAFQALRFQGASTVPAADRRARVSCPCRHPAAFRSR